MAERPERPESYLCLWLMELQELPFRISYRPGRENQVANYLSRNPGLNYDETVNQVEQFEDILYKRFEEVIRIREEQRRLNDR